MLNKLTFSYTNKKISHLVRFNYYYILSGICLSSIDLLVILYSSTYNNLLCSPMYGLALLFSMNIPIDFIDVEQ